jgi:hypothetical protein
MNSIHVPRAGTYNSFPANLRANFEALLTSVCSSSCSGVAVVEAFAAKAEEEEEEEEEDLVIISHLPRRAPRRA